MTPVPPSPCPSDERYGATSRLAPSRFRMAHVDPWLGCGHLSDWNRAAAAARLGSWADASPATTTPETRRASRANRFMVASSSKRSSGGKMFGRNSLRRRFHISCYATGSNATVSLWQPAETCWSCLCGWDGFLSRAEKLLLGTRSAMLGGDSRATSRAQRLRSGVNHRARERFRRHGSSLHLAPVNGLAIIRLQQPPEHCGVDGSGKSAHAAIGQRTEKDVTALAEETFLGICFGDG